MKKTISFLLVLVLCAMALSACGGDSGSSSSAAQSVPEQQNTAAAVSAAQPQSQPTVAADPLYSLNFTLHNYSNAALTEIRISHSDETTFGDNLLPAGYVLPDGNNVDIVFDAGAAAGTTYDMYTMDSDGDAYEYYGIPLTEIVELALYVEFYSNGTYNNYYEMIYAQ